MADTQMTDRKNAAISRGVGMTKRQQLLLVQLPLAAPVIIAGLRTSTVWVVGIATLATPVGATSLGNYIFSGLQTRQFDVVLLGCFASALLALIMDGLIRLLEIAADRRSAPFAIAGVIGIIALLAVGFAPMAARALDGDDRPRVVIGAKTFTEQHILADLLGRHLERAGFRTTVRSSLGSTVAFDAG